MTGTEYEIREPGMTSWATCDNIEDARKELSNAWERGLHRAQIYIVEEDGTRTPYAPDEDEEGVGGTMRYQCYECGKTYRGEIDAHQIHVCPTCYGVE